MYPYAKFSQAQSIRGSQLIYTKTSVRLTSWFAFTCQAIFQTNIYYNYYYIVSLSSDVSTIRNYQSTLMWSS